MKCEEYKIINKSKLSLGEALELVALAAKRESKEQLFVIQCWTYEVAREGNTFTVSKYDDGE